MANNFNILVEYINGGLNDGGAAIQIADNELKTAQNIRYLENGGWYTRPGYIDAVLSTGNAKPFDGLYAMKDDSMIFGITNGKIYHNATGAMSLIYSGMTSGQSTQLDEYNGDVYLTNIIDGFKRIALSTIQTVVVAGATIQITVAAGQGWRFGTSGTININGDDITYSGRTNDVLTVTPATISSNHSIGDVISEVTSISGVNGSDVSFYGEKCLITGVPGTSGNTYTDSVAFYSETATAANPEKIYSFPAPNRELIGKGGAITATISTRDNTFVFKRRSIEYIYSIDPTSGAPLHKEVSSIYGVPGPDCVCQMGNVVAFFTGKEIKTLGLQSEIVTTFTIDPYFDKKIQRTLQTLDEDQSNAVLIFDPTRRYLKLWANANGQRVCFVYFIPSKTSNNRRFSGAWAIDLGKSADKAILWKNDIYWSATDLIFQDEFGQDDNGSPIAVVVESKEFTAGSFIEPDEWHKLAFVGSMGENSEFDLSIYVDNTVVATETVTAAEMVTPTSGFPIGTSNIGYNSIGGGGGSLATVYPFNFPLEKLMMGIGSKCWYRIESNATTTAYQIDQVSFFGEKFSDEALSDDR